MKYSVIVTTYRRYGRIREILRAWKDAGADEVILANGGRAIRKDGDFFAEHLYNPDPGNRIRFASAHLAKNDFVVLADDDVMPKPHIFADFWFYYSDQPGIYGVIGRKPNADSYFKTTFFKASEIKSPVQTFFVGVIYFTHRKYLQFDISKIPNKAVDDLYWHMVAFPDVKKIVFPTTEYENMFPECNDKDCIFHSGEAREVRDSFYIKYRRSQ